MTLSEIKQQNKTKKTTQLGFVFLIIYIGKKKKKYVIKIAGGRPKRNKVRNVRRNKYMNSNYNN